MNNQKTPEEMSKDIHLAWDAAWSKEDIDALLELYADDVVFESPLVPHLLGTSAGVCRGKEELRKLLNIAKDRKPCSRHYFIKNFFTNGKMMMWEYPRLSPTGEQMDFVEVMELENSLISKHRVYWGWFGCDILKKDAYYR